MSDRFTGLPDPPPPGAPKMSPSLGGGLRPGRVALLGCGVLLVLVGIAAVVFLLQADDFVGWVFGSVEETIVERLPEDLPAAERRRLERAFDGALATLESGEGDPQAMRRLQGQLTAVLRGAGEDRPLTRDEVAAIAAALEAAAGPERDPGAPPVAVPGARPGPDSDRP